MGKERQPVATLYHDIEQNIDVNCDFRNCRNSVKSLLDIEKNHGVTATYNVVGRLFEEQPDLINWIRDGGHDIAYHSYHHQPNWHPGYYAHEVQLCRKVSHSIQGYRSPRSEWNNATLEALWNKGFSWNAEYDTRSGPYYVFDELIRLPIAADDWLVHTGHQTIEDWIEQFSTLLSERAYFGFGCHDCLVAEDADTRLAAWESIIAVAQSRNVKLVSFSQAANLFRSNPTLFQ